jgi:endoglucanase
MINLDLLKQVCEKPGAPGFEDQIRSFVRDQVEELVDEVRVDNIGNLLAYRKGTHPKKVMIAAHMDEISFIVTHIDDDGFIRFSTMGGFDPKTLTAQRVIIHGNQDIVGVMGSKPIHMMTDEERRKLPQIDDFFIDTGISKEEVSKIVNVGDPITRERSLIEMGDCVNSKSLDNRVSVFILIETLKNLKDKELPFDLYAVFTVQEEVGLRGAISAAHSINPDFGIALDVTIAYDLPGSKPHESVSIVGKGAAIKIMDGSTICDTRMVSFLKETAKKNNIPWQAEVMTKGGTDTAGLQRYGKTGSIAGAISIPTRYLHQVIEMAHKRDIQNCINLLGNALLIMDQHDWSR